MGMDAYIFKARTKKVFSTDDWYNSEAVTEVWYTRKYWDLINKLSFIKNTEEDSCQYIQLSKENIEEMIEVATHNPDYWGGFSTVPALCEILWNFDDDAEMGWHYYFEFDY